MDTREYRPTNVQLYCSRGCSDCLRNQVGLVDPTRDTQRMIIAISMVCLSFILAAWIASSASPETQGVLAFIASAASCVQLIRLSFELSRHHSRMAGVVPILALVAIAMYSHSWLVATTALGIYLAILSLMFLVLLDRSWMKIMNLAASSACCTVFLMILS